MGTQGRGLDPRASGPKIGASTIISTGDTAWLLLNELGAGAGGMGRVFLTRDLVTSEAIRQSGTQISVPDKPGVYLCPPDLFPTLAAESMHLPTQVLKLIEPWRWDPAHRREMIERFMQEALACGLMNSPQFPAFSGVARREPVHFFVMERVEGVSMQRFFDEEFFRRGESASWELIFDVFGQLLHAIHHAHAKGVVHRDLKPDNVMIVRMPPVGLFVRIIDFGLAKLVGAPTQPTLETPTGTATNAPAYRPPRTQDLTGQGSPTLLTPAFGAPEQHLDGSQRQTGPWTDIYQLGGILYWMLTGRTWLPTTVDRAAIIQAMRQPMPPLVRADLGERANTALHRLVASMLAYQPADRPWSVQGVITALQAVEDARGTETAAKLAAIREEPPAKRRGLRWPMIAIGIALAAIIAALVALG